MEVIFLQASTLSSAVAAVGLGGFRTFSDVLERFHFTERGCNESCDAGGR